MPWLFQPRHLDPRLLDFDGNHKRLQEEEEEKEEKEEAEPVGGTNHEFAPEGKKEEKKKEDEKEEKQCTKDFGTLTCGMFHACSWAIA